MNRHLSTEGIVLRKTDFNEADRIVTLLTRDHGKIDCIAKGARRLKSKFCGRLELFCHIRLTGFQGRDLVTLDEVNLITPFPQGQSLEQHRVLFTLAESTHKLIHAHQHIEGAYPLLLETLEALGGTQKHEALLYAYLIRLLTLTGFLPQWNHCALCDTAFHASLPIFVRLGDAHALCGNCKTPADRLLNAGIPQWISHMQRMPMTESLKVASAEGQRNEVWAWLKEVLQNILTYPLKTEEFLVG
jgi:DNA repair protein RecO (recombination protein O)